MAQDLISTEAQRHLEDFFKERGITNYSIDISPGTVVGDNYLSIITKIKITSKGGRNDGDKTLNFIVKTAPPNKIFRSIFPLREAFEREIYIYNNVLPELLKFQKDKGILKPFAPFAKYYTSSLNDFNELLVLEDVKVLGFEQSNRFLTLDYNHTMYIVKQYGKLHALSYAMKDQKPELFDMLASNTRDRVFDWFKPDDIVKQNSVRDRTDRALDSLDPIVDKDVYERFKKSKNAILEKTREAVSPEKAGPYAVIGHGDGWTNNFLFKYADASNRQVPSEVCLLDWQLSRYGSPALDLSYFLFTCTDSKLRDEHYNEFIQEYYNSLCSFLRELGSDPEHLLPFEVLQEHLKKFSIYGLYMTILVLFLTTSDATDIPVIHESKNEEELGDIFAFTTMTSKLDVYKSKIRRVLLDFAKFGYDF